MKIRGRRRLSLIFDYRKRNRTRHLFSFLRFRSRGSKDHSSTANVIPLSFKLSCGDTEKKNKRLRPLFLGLKPTIDTTQKKIGKPTHKRHPFSLIPEPSPDHIICSKGERESCENEPTAIAIFSAVEESSIAEPITISIPSPPDSAYLSPASPKPSIVSLSPTLSENDDLPSPWDTPYSFVTVPLQSHQ